MKSFQKSGFGLLVATTVCMAGAFVSVAALAAQAEKGADADRLPDCTDHESLALVRESLDAGDKLTVLGLHSPRQLRISDGGDLRTCVVDVVTDHGGRTTTFMIGWEDRGAGTTFVAGERLE